MKIETKQIDEVSIISLSGRITIGEGDTAFREVVRQEFAKGSLKILINFSEVIRIDSSGIGELVSAYTIMSSRGGKLKLCNLPNKVIEILQVTQLLNLFEIYHDENEAVKSFN